MQIEISDELINQTVEEGLKKKLTSAINRYVVGYSFEQKIRDRIKILADETLDKLILEGLEDKNNLSLLVKQEMVKSLTRKLNKVLKE